MPVTYKQGKDSIIFVTKEDHSAPSTITLPKEEPPPGLILKDGSINWSCPCLGGMATGPCGVEFREAFSCFHYSEAEPKGSDCYDAFKTMQECMAKYPTLYNKEGNEEELDNVMDDKDILGKEIDENAALDNVPKVNDRAECSAGDATDTVTESQMTKSSNESSKAAS